MQLPQVDVVQEGHVVTGMPVQRVEDGVEVDLLQEVVDGLDDLFSVVLGWTVSDV